MMLQITITEATNGWVVGLATQEEDAIVLAPNRNFLKKVVNTTIDAFVDDSTLGLRIPRSKKDPVDSAPEALGE